MSHSRRSVQSGRASTRWRRASWGVRETSSGIRLRLSKDGRRSGMRSGQQPWLQSATIWSWLRPSWMEPVSLCHMVWSHQNTHTRSNVLPFGVTAKLSMLWISQHKYASSLIILRMMRWLSRDYCWDSYIIVAVVSNPKHLGWIYGQEVRAKKTEKGERLCWLVLLKYCFYWSELIVWPRNEVSGEHVTRVEVNVVVTGCWHNQRFLMWVFFWSSAGCLTESYDELGNRYQLPKYTLAPPVNLVTESSSESKDCESAQKPGQPPPCRAEFQLRVRLSTGERTMHD